MDACATIVIIESSYRNRDQERAKAAAEQEAARCDSKPLCYAYVHHNEKLQAYIVSIRDRTECGDVK
jgi:hypothetical protein